MKNVGGIRPGHSCLARALRGLVQTRIKKNGITITVTIARAAEYHYLSLYRQHGYRRHKHKPCMVLPCNWVSHCLCYK